MAVYSYTALDGRGGEQAGEIEAGDARLAAQSLRARNIYVLEIREGSERKPMRSLRRHLALRRYLPVTTSDMVQFYRQMALMLRSGHTVVQSLEAIEGLVGKRALEQGIARMNGLIRGGAGFSAAIAREKRLFPPMAARLIESGEQSGEIDPILTRLGDNLEQQQDLKRQVKTAMTYPAFVVVTAIGVVVLLVAWVIPRFARFLTARKVEIPGSTQWLMDFADWFAAYGAVTGGVAGLALFLILAAYTTAPGKREIDRILLAVPIVGRAILFGGMAQAGWTLAMLIRSGVTIVQSLRITSGVMANAILSQAFAGAVDELTRGRSLAVALEQPGLPEMVRHLAAVGERSGELEHVMDEVGEYYRKELQALIKLLTAWLEPAMILLIGGMVGFVYFAFFQAVLRVSTGGI